MPLACLAIYDPAAEYASSSEDFAFDDTLDEAGSGVVGGLYGGDFVLLVVVEPVMGARTIWKGVEAGSRDVISFSRPLSNEEDLDEVLARGKGILRDHSGEILLLASRKRSRRGSDDAVDGDGQVVVAIARCLPEQEPFHQSWQEGTVRLDVLEYPRVHESHREVMGRSMLLPGYEPTVELGSGPDAEEARDSGAVPKGLDDSLYRDFLRRGEALRRKGNGRHARELEELCFAIEAFENGASVDRPRQARDSQCIAKGRKDVDDLDPTVRDPAVGFGSFG